MTVLSLGVVILVLILINPLILLLIGRMVNAGPISFKPALVLNAIILISWYLCGLGIRFALNPILIFSVGDLVIKFFLILIPLLIGTWIIKKKFKTVTLRSFALSLALFLFVSGLLYTVRTHVVTAKKIATSSMEPTIRAGDHILVNKWLYAFKEPQRGDIVLIKNPENPSIDLVKRIIGLPGETVQIDDQKVTINQVPLPEKYAVYREDKLKKSHFQDIINDFKSLHIPSDSFFLMGDNRFFSIDSRYWGAVHRKKILGKITFIYWSWDPDNKRIRWERLGRGNR